MSSVAVPPLDSQTELMDWIDDSATTPENLDEVVRRLTALTLAPESPELPGAVSPFRGDLENQFWAWNRAGDRFGNHAHHAAAAEVWAASYLAFLSLQERWGHRYPKGMPLCNIGFALRPMPSKRSTRLRAWLLGIVEDVLMSGGRERTANYENVLVTKGTEAGALEQLVDSVLVRFVDEGVTSLLPEGCIEFWLEPTRLTPSERCRKSIASLRNALHSSYPQLPKWSGGYLSLLEVTWAFMDDYRELADVA